MEEENIQHTLQPSQGGISTSMHVTAPPHVTLQMTQVRAPPLVAQAAAPLSLEDTQDVMYEARDKWQNIGGVFHVPDPSLSSIAQEESSSDGRLRRVIRSWLEKCAGTPSATWAEVAHTLRNVTVGRDDLAWKVEEKYLQHTLQPSQGGISTSTHVTRPPHVPPQPLERQLSKTQCTQHGWT